MTADAVSRLTELIDRIGPGDLVGSVVVDQVYAHFQHERLDLNHPHGGEAKFLERPLLSDRLVMFQQVADTVLDDGGKRGMKNAVEHLSDQVELRAPVLWGDLRRSGHPMAAENEHTYFDRAPKARRLSEAELRAKGRSRPMPGPLLGYIWWHVMHHQHPPNFKGGA
jgi:hypothetical protein